MMSDDSLFSKTADAAERRAILNRYADRLMKTWRPFPLHKLDVLVDHRNELDSSLRLRLISKLRHLGQRAFDCADQLEEAVTRGEEPR
jgi:hypothetical protein